MVNRPSPRKSTLPVGTVGSRRFPEINQFNPASIAKTPLRIREVIHLRLRIEMRVSRAKHALLEREAIGPDCEFCRKTYRQGHVAFRCELHGLPVKVADVQRMVHCAPRIEGEAQISSMRSEEHTSELQSQSNLVCRLLL